MTAPRPLSLGRHINNFLAEHHLIQQQLADAMGVNRNVVNQLVRNKKSLTPEMAIRLETATGRGADFWMLIQVVYDLYGARAKMRRYVKLLKPLV
jgi:addiction module HigA family antidote